MATVANDQPGLSNLRFEHYDTEGFYDEMFERDGQPAPAGRAAGPAADVAVRRRAAAPPEGRRPGAVEHGHHVQRLRPRGRHRKDLAVRHRAADHRAPRNGTASSDGLKQRIRALNLFIDDIYHEQQDRPRRRRARVAGRNRASASCDRCAGLKPPQGHLVPHHGHRPGARRRRPVLRARRQPPLPVGRVVRAGKPRGDEADVSADVRRPVDPAGRRLSRAAAARCCSTSRRRGVARADGRAC